METLRAGRRGVASALLRAGIACVLLSGMALASGLQAAGRGEPGPVFPARVTLTDEQADLKLLHDMDIDVDAVFRGWARVYLVAEELDKLRRLGLEVAVLAEEPEIVARRAAGGESPAATRGPSAYHTYDTLVADMQAIAAAFPNITRLISAGQSVQGRELLFMKISRNPDLDEDEPEVSYIAAMHGDEVVGKEMCFGLIDYLTSNYGSDPRVTTLVDTTEIWIMPSMNPDGTQLVQRYNAHYVDLNRNFPDQFVDPVNTPDGREPETQAIMNWALGRRRSLSANLHGGTVVANYPFDGNAQSQSVYSPTPDDSPFVSLARIYADNNPTMAVSNASSSFNYGITNGADWYVINGGMQDWNYVWRGNFEITLEISTQKWPAASTLPDFWADNLESMLAYLERVHEGVRGIVTDAMTGAPLAATVHVAGNGFPAYTDPDVGDYHRILLPGTYTLEVSATGYSTRVLHDVVVTGGPATRYDVALEPLDADLQPDGSCVHQGASCDAWLEPGTAADLGVTLRNLGIAATGVSARVEPTGWFTDVFRPEAGYPDLPPGGTGESEAPHHGVTVSPMVPAGHKVGFAVRWQSDQGVGLSEPFYLPVGSPSCTSVAASDLPKSIQDRATTTSSVVFPTELEVSGVEVTLNLSHTYVGDLRVDLVSPAGITIALHDRSGGSTDDIVGTYGVDLTPFEPFSRLSGSASSGTWNLRVNDGAPGDTGTLNAWSLEVCGRSFEAAPPEMRLREVRLDSGGVRLAWWPYPGIESYRVYRSSDPSTAGAFVDVTTEDPDPADTVFEDGAAGPVAFWLVTAVGPGGEGPKGHFGE